MFRDHAGNRCSRSRRPRRCQHSRHDRFAFAADNTVERLARVGQNLRGHEAGAMSAAKRKLSGRPGGCGLPSPEPPARWPGNSGRSPRRPAATAQFPKIVARRLHLEIEDSHVMPGPVGPPPPPIPIPAAPAGDKSPRTSGNWDGAGGPSWAVTVQFVGCVKNSLASSVGKRWDS